MTDSSKFLIYSFNLKIDEKRNFKVKLTSSKM